LYALLAEGSTHQDRDHLDVELERAAPEDVERAAAGRIVEEMFR